jgi:hypothetical protein
VISGEQKMNKSRKSAAGAASAAVLIALLCLFASWNWRRSFEGPSNCQITSNYAGEKMDEANNPAVPSTAGVDTRKQCKSGKQNNVFAGKIGPAGAGGNFRSDVGGFGRQTLEELTEEFSSMNEDGRINIIINLGSFEPALLSAALSDESADVRVAAVKSLRWIDTNQKNLLPYVNVALNDVAVEVREEGYKVMDSLDEGRDRLSLVKTALESKYDDARQKAVSGFIGMEIPGEEFREQVIKALSDKNQGVRSQALSSALFLWNLEYNSEGEVVQFLSER